MIARIWMGRTKAQDLEAYTDFLKARAIPDYRGTEGFVKLSFLRRSDEEFAYFQLVTYWENLEVIKRFAGEDVDLAKYYPEDEGFLLEFPKRVTHFEVFAE